MLLRLLIHCLSYLTTAALSLVSVKEWSTLTSQTAAKDYCILCLDIIEKKKKKKEKTPKAALSEARSGNFGMNFRQVPKMYVVNKKKNKKQSLKKDRHEKIRFFIHVI